MKKKRKKLKEDQIRENAEKGVEVRKAKWNEKNLISMEFPVPSYLDISDQL